jgi:hypothetical protein
LKRASPRRFKRSPEQFTKERSVSDALESRV